VPSTRSSRTPGPRVTHGLGPHLIQGGTAGTDAVARSSRTSTAPSRRPKGGSCRPVRAAVPDGQLARLKAGQLVPTASRPSAPCSTSSLSFPPCASASSRRTQRHGACRSTTDDKKGIVAEGRPFSIDLAQVSRPASEGPRARPADDRGPRANRAGARSGWRAPASSAETQKRSTSLSHSHSPSSRFRHSEASWRRWRRSRGGCDLVKPGTEGSRLWGEPSKGYGPRLRPHREF
jgi:hypothetical protein